MTHQKVLTSTLWKTNKWHIIIFLNNKNYIKYLIMLICNHSGKTWLIIFLAVQRISFCNCTTSHWDKKCTWFFFSLTFLWNLWFLAFLTNKEMLHIVWKQSCFISKWALNKGFPTHWNQLLFIIHNKKRWKVKFFIYYQIP